MQRGVSLHIGAKSWHEEECGELMGKRSHGKGLGFFWKECQGCRV